MKLDDFLYCAAIVLIMLLVGVGIIPDMVDV
jgi:hypothetical protein